MLDDLGKLTATDESGFLTSLTALPGSFDGPAGLRPESYGLMGFGEAAPVCRVLGSWVDAPLVVSGTQFFLAAGFDHGELAPLKLSAEMTGAEVVVLGYDAYEPDLRVTRGVLSPYTYAAYLAHATGHAEALAEAERAMAALRDRFQPTLPTDQNPAKALAWTLWNRVPLLLASRPHAGLPELVQHVFARVGKVLAITVGEHPLEVLSSAFENRHVLGDEVVGVMVSPEGRELELAREVLSTRVAQVETLVGEDGVISGVTDVAARGLVVWYASLWVAAYLALLHGTDPAVSSVYDALSQVA